MTTPADELRTAAAALRQARFPAAMTATPSAVALIRARLPLADWLDRMADANDAVNDWTLGVVATLNLEALAVARAINGGTR